MKMTPQLPFSRLPLLLAVILSVASLGARAAENKILWEIGAADRDNAEFALAPGGYAKFERDPLFVVGRSSPKTDWPYVHPGPADPWAGSRPHAFFVVFCLVQQGGEGTCRLVLDLLDAQSKTPPDLRIQINGRAFERTLSAGNGDATILGDPKAGRASQVTVEFPAALLRAGNNLIQITTTAGSWLLYDRVALETPARFDLRQADDFTSLVEARPDAVLAQKEGKSLQRITALVAHAGRPLRAAFRLGSKEVRQVELTNGFHEIELLVPPVNKVCKATLSLADQSRVFGFQPITLVPGVREIVIVFKTHFDIGYTDMASNIVQRYRTTMIDQALDVVDQNRDLPTEQQFAWTISGWPLHKILEDWPGQSAERKQRVENALKQGRFVVHALPFTTHTELLEPEDLVRGLGYSSEIAHRLGLEMPRDGKMTDVPEHTWMMATLLKKAGVDFMMIGCNGASAALKVPPLYWWQGPDGSRILTMYSPDYGTQLTPPHDWPYRTWLACLHTGDNHGPPRPAEVKQILDQAAKQFPGVKVRIGRLSDFGDAILAEKADLPVVRQDTPDTWIHGPMSDPDGARLARHTRPLIPTTESLNTQLSGWGVKVDDATASISAAYEQSLLYGEHTWGGALYWVNNTVNFGEQFKKDRAAGRYQRLESSWDEHSAYIQKAQSIIQPELEKNLRTLASNVDKKGKRIVVYNPLPWKRSGLVTIKKPAAFDLEAVVAADGSATALVAREGDELSFFAEDIPAMGYRTYAQAQTGRTVGPAFLTRANSLEGPFFKAELDPRRGTVVSLTDKRSGRELIDNSAKVGMGQFLYERFDRDQVLQWCKDYCRPGYLYPDFYKPGQPPADQRPYSASSPTNFQVRFIKSPLSITAEMETAATADLPAVTTRLILYANQPCADLEITLHNKPMDPWPEAGWLCLPLKVGEPEFRLGRLGSIINPATDIVPGANRHIFGINTGVAMFDHTEHGVGFCPMDNPIVSLDVPGCWKYSTNFVPRKPVAYVNLFNNQWNTNFRLWNQGTWTARVRLWNINHFDGEQSLITPSLEARYPLQTAYADGPRGTLPVIQRGLEVSRKGIMVSAFSANPEGPGRILRLWEYSGNSGQCRVWLPKSMLGSAVQPIDLRNRPVGQPLRVSSGGFITKLGAFEPASFLITPTK